MKRMRSQIREIRVIRCLKNVDIIRSWKVGWWSVGSVRITAISLKVRRVSVAVGGTMMVCL